MQSDSYRELNIFQAYVRDFDYEQKKSIVMFD